MKITYDERESVLLTETGEQIGSLMPRYRHLGPLIAAAKAIPCCDCNKEIKADYAVCPECEMKRWRFHKKAEASGDDKLAVAEKRIETLTAALFGIMMRCRGIDMQPTDLGMVADIAARALGPGAKEEEAKQP